MMRQWLVDGAIPANLGDRLAVDEFTSPSYEISIKDEIKLEPKSMIKKRGGVSPDFADALAVTFAMPELTEGNAQLRVNQKLVTDYDPMAEGNIIYETA
jgi:hypothetical protein